MVSDYEDIGRRIRRIIESRIPAVISVITTSLPKMIETKGFPCRYYIEEKDNEYRVLVEVPGASKEDIKIYVQDRTIYIQAKNSVESRYMPREYRAKIELEDPIDPEGTRARYINGVLVIEAPRKERGREVKVE